MALLTLEDVSYFYEGTHNGICDISFEAEKGDFIAVVGKNGAGKTTLLNVLSGIYILGIATFPIVGVVIQASILYILSFFVGGFFALYRFCMIIVFLMISVLFWASILICVALLIKNYKQRDFVMDTLLVPILFATPLFYSFDNAPFILKCISRMNPLTYQVDAMRAIAFGIPDFTTICIVLVFTVVAYLFAIFCLSNSDFKNDEH